MAWINRRLSGTLTAQYRADSDIIGQFIGECLVENHKFNTSLKNVHATYEKWCDENGFKALNSRNLATELRLKTIDVKKEKDNNVYLIGYTLISDRKETQE